MNLRDSARELMLRNYHATGSLYICPSFPHYPYQWLWDSCFHSVICSELGLHSLAENEIEKLLLHQHENGFIPHIIFYGRRHISFRKNLDTLIWELFERGTFPKDTKYLHSSFTQPPVMGRALKFIKNRDFIRRVFPAVLRFYRYFPERQDPDGDGLISNPHPCETGRDNTPEFDFFKTRLKRISRLNNYLETYSMSRLNRAYGKVGWDMEKIWELGIVDVEDVMFNCIWIDGMYCLSELCEDPHLSEEIYEMARRSEESLYRLAWDEEEGVFWSLRRGHEKIRHLTVSNLFPLILPNLPKRMLDSLVKLLTDPQKFWTTYPIPSVALSDPSFNPEYGVERMCWRGPTWLNMNWYIVQGLIRHGRFDIAEELSRRSIEVVRRSGFREFYHPITGAGMRVEYFGWSALVVTLPSLLNMKRGDNWP